MRVRLFLALSATLLLCGCNPAGSPALVPRAHLRRTPTTPTPIPTTAEVLEALKRGYRLAPDRRFLLAFGEVDRLAARSGGPPGPAATATFSQGKWALELGGSNLGSLPELPDFADYFALLVAHAKKSRVRVESSPKTPSQPSRFLIPGLLTELRLAESRSTPDASRCFARMAYQMPDRAEVAPLIPARALALAAVVRASNARAALEEEILLAHVLGYTGHAETLAHSLPAGAPLRLFEELRDDKLLETASRADASEDSRFFALQRAGSAGETGRWKEALDRFFPGDKSAALIATGFDLSLPRQVELEDWRWRLAENLQQTVLREMGGGISFDASVLQAGASVSGFLWDRNALTAYYEAAYHAPWLYFATVSPKYWPPASTALEAELLGMLQKGKGISRGGNAAGAAVLMQVAWDNVWQRPGYREKSADVRALAVFLDSRPAHRVEFARYSHEVLMDVAAAEDLHRSLLRILSDGSLKPKASSALYVGDWATLERLLASRQIAAPDASWILGLWYGTKVELDRVDREYQRFAERFSKDWDVTSSYVGFLRKRKQYKESCVAVERWLSWNADPRTPGYFHAHIRLAHNYFLAGEPRKGLELLQGMAQRGGGFQDEIVKRGIAECLVGLGQIGEAERLTRSYLRAYPDDSEAVRDLVRLLWTAGREGEAARTLAAAVGKVPSWDICACLETDFLDVFRNRPPEKVVSAFAALSRETALSDSFDCAPRGFVAAERWEDAWKISSEVARRLEAKEPNDYELVRRYTYMKGWKGREAATEWLRDEVPVGKRNSLATQTMFPANFDILWDVIVTPDKDERLEGVWLLRALANTLEGIRSGPRYEQLVAYFQTESADPDHLMGRYLLGLAGEADLMPLVTGYPRLSEVAYCFAVRARAEKRFREACDWYRLAADSPALSDYATYGVFALMDWASTGQGIWRVEASKN